MTGAQSGPATGPVPVTRLDKSGWVVLGTLMLATVLANIASVCLFPQIVSLSEEFGRPVNQVVWSMIGFHVIAAGVGGVAAALGAIMGNRRMLSVVLALLFVGSLMSALSTDLPLLIAGRFLQGVSMAIQALSIGIIAVYWRGEAMRRAMSMVVLAMGLGAVLAYLLSGFIWRSGGNWRTASRWARLLRPAFRVQVTDRDMIRRFSQEIGFIAGWGAHPLDIARSPYEVRSTRPRGVRGP